MNDLYAAIFGSVLRARAGVEGVIRQNHAFTASLPNLTIFLRTGKHAVEIGLLSLDANRRVINVPKGALDVPMFRQFAPKNVNWNVLQASRSEKHPTDKITSDFVSYLDVIIHPQSCALLFVPESEDQRENFLNGMEEHAQVVIHTKMSEADLGTMRAFLVKAEDLKAARG